MQFLLLDGYNYHRCVSIKWSNKLTSLFLSYVLCPSFPFYLMAPPWATIFAIIVHSSHCLTSRSFFPEVTLFPSFNLHFYLSDLLPYWLFKKNLPDSITPCLLISCVLYCQESLHESLLSLHQYLEQCQLLKQELAHGMCSVNTCESLYHSFIVYWNSF